MSELLLSPQSYVHTVVLAQRGIGNKNNYASHQWRGCSDLIALPRKASHLRSLCHYFHVAATWDDGNPFVIHWCLFSDEWYIFPSSSLCEHYIVCQQTQTDGQTVNVCKMQSSGPKCDWHLIKPIFHGGGGCTQGSWWLKGGWTKDPHCMYVVLKWSLADS